MKPVIRSRQPPHVVVGAWAVAAVLGFVAVTTGWLRASSPPQTLGPATLARYLASAVGTDAQEIRVNGVYGSAHGGAWQFVAHLTWRDTAGQIHGGTTNLPILADDATLPSPFGAARLTREESMGWSLSTIASTMSHLPNTDAPLALVELQITPGDASLVACSAQRNGPGRCTEYGADGRSLRTFSATLTDVPAEGALAVQRGNRL